MDENRTIKLAAAAYNLDWLNHWDDYEAKLTRWVEEAVENDADILLFPEYGTLELASLDGEQITANIEDCIDAVSTKMGRVDALHQTLAQKHQVHICGASASVRSNLGERPVNRAKFFSPDGGSTYQDKLIMTRFEREEWDIIAGQDLNVFETALGTIGIIICYDSEFPLIARSMVESGAEILLCPSVTETYAGYTRVKTGCMARALENQCVVAHAPLVGEAKWIEAADISIGAAGIYGPPDTGFPETGILSMGELDKPGWVYAEFSLAQIRNARKNGTVLNHAHWQEQDERLQKVRSVRL